jgi:poly-gamma-glutamate synthesis protein (capsule biosynthesis protein)
VSHSRRAFVRGVAGAVSVGCGSLSGCATPVGSGASDAGAGPSLPETDARLGFVGDAMLGRNVDKRWSSERGDRRDLPPAGVWGSLTERLAELDGLFCNLECTLAEGGTRRPGRTYYFRADPDWALPALTAAGTTFAGLANNHVLDFGTAALSATREHLDGAGIAHAGAGPSLRAALQPALVEVGGLSVAVVSVTDRSPSYGAGLTSPGTAFGSLHPRDPLTRLAVGDALRRARALDPDLTVASLHWGPNWDPTPAPTQRRMARWLVERGVDLVHGHSAHVIQGIEVVDGRPILYDCGDFVDDYIHKEGLHNKRSFLFELGVADGGFDALRLRPVEIGGRAVDRADGEAAAWLRDRMRSLSEPFGTEFERAGDGLRLALDAE